MNFKELRSLNMKHYLATGGPCFSNSLYNNLRYELKDVSQSRVLKKNKTCIYFESSHLVKLLKVVKSNRAI